MVRVCVRVGGQTANHSWPFSSGKVINLCVCIFENICYTAVRVHKIFSAYTFFGEIDSTITVHLFLFLLNKILYKKVTVIPPFWQACAECGGKKWNKYAFVHRNISGRMLKLAEVAFKMIDETQRNMKTWTDNPISVWRSRKSSLKCHFVKAYSYYLVGLVIWLYLWVNFSGCERVCIVCTTAKLAARSRSYICEPKLSLGLSLCLADSHVSNIKYTAQYLKSSESNFIFLSHNGMQLRPASN